MLTLVPLTLGLQLSGWMIGILVVLFVLVSVILMLTILIQKPQGGGLSAAFGAGGGSGQTAFGTKTGDALTIATISMFAVWLLFGVGLNYALTPSTTPPARTTITGDGAPASGTSTTTTGTAGTSENTTSGDATPAENPAPATPENESPTPATPEPSDTPAPATPDKPAEPAPESPAGNP